MVTAKGRELRALAQRLAGAFAPEVVEVVLTGSVSRGVADELSDIEMLVLTEQHLSLEEAFALAEEAGLTDTETWGDPATPTRRVHGYLDGQSIETIWWFPELAEERFATTPSAEAIANGVALRGGDWLASAQERLADYPDELVAERCEQAAERWGGWTPRGLLTTVREDTALARMEWIVEAAQRVLQIVYALNRVHQPSTKRLAMRVEPLAIKPDRLAERIEEALTEPDPRRALLTMTELQLDTVRLAPSGPNVDRARAWLEAGAALLR
ncbi:MAG: nucleotidyltransferase domain-containing protein [Gaiellaceae bacterium]